jgi:hypothetical protein
VDPASTGRGLQVAGSLALATPVVLALAAVLRGRHRAAGWLLVLAFLAPLPAAVMIERGAAKVRQAHRENAPAVERCVEHSGGDTKCPGG